MTHVVEQDELLWRSLSAPLRSLLEATPAMVVVTDADGRPTFTNRAWEDFTGSRAADGPTWAERGAVHPDDFQRAARAWRRARAAGVGYDVEYRIRDRDGEYRWVDFRIRPVKEDAGTVVSWTSAAIDIDEHVRLREELQATNERLQVLAEAGLAIADAVDYDAALEGAARVLVPSFAAWCAVDILENGTVRRRLSLHAPEVGEEVARILGETPPTLDDPSDSLTGVLLSGEGIFLPQMPDDVSVFARSPDHLRAIEGLRPNSTIAVPLRAVGGRTLGALSVARVGSQPPFTRQDFATVLDVGRRLAAALDRSRLFTQVGRVLGNLRLLADAGLALSRSRELDEVLEEAARLLVPAYADWCTVDLLEGDQLRRASLAHGAEVDEAAAAALRRLSVRRDVLDDGTARIVATAEPLFLAAIPPDLRPGADGPAEYRAAAAALRPGSTIGVPLAAHDTVFGVLGLMRVEGREPFDDSDLALARELGRQLGGWLERGRLFSDLCRALSAKDEFFGFVSHEMKTPLTTVVGVADVLSRRYGELDEAQRQDAIALVRRDSLRLEQIIANMLTLARSERQTGEEPALVQHVIAGAVATHRQRHPLREVEVEVEPRLTPVLAPGGWIDRVVENLLSNAEKYSEPGAPIRIEAAPAVGTIEVRVLDRGRGISPEQMRDVFEPFFRANPNEAGVSGAGLGLTVCRRLVEQLGGEVWLGPREGGGTVAGFRLPVMDIPEE